MSKVLELIESKKHYDGVTLVERLKECHTPAISLAIIENFEISETYVYGVKQRKTKETVTEETLFQGASISKPVFAVAMMRLVEQGIFELDRDVSDDLIGYEVPTFDQQKHKMTLRQLLSHHAGLNLPGFAGYQQGQAIPTIEEILRGAPPTNHLKLKLMKTPEAECQYSGGGYVLAQKMMTDVCERGFSELMNDLVLSPLEMTRSTFALPKVEDVAFGYNEHNLELPGGFNYMPELSAAGLWTTPSDLARFGIDVMKSLNNKGGILEKNTATLMTTAAYENSPFGVGFQISESKKGAVFGHSGSNVGYKSNMCFCPSDGSGLVVMINGDIGRSICGEVTNAFKEIYGW